MAKKYYWLRLKDDWFNSKVIKKLRKIAGGDTYTIIYLKMQLLSLKNEGKLYYEGVEDSFEEELALDLDEDIDNVTVTVSYLQKCGLLEVISKDQYLLTEVPAVTGSESASAERVRKHRAQKELTEQMSEMKALQCNTDVTESNAEVTNCNTEKEIEKEIEKRERDINIPARSSGKQPSEPEADVEALNQLAKDVVRGYNYSGNMTGKVNYKADTIYEILGLNKVNTRTLQAIDGNHYELRLLQVAQQLGIQMKPEQLKEFYETFECNTDLLKEKNRKVSLHKLCRYIDRESERYPIGEKNTCMRGYSYNRYKERTDPRIERKQNMAHDWLEYIGWCRELKYDLNNMFIYMPNNFKKVHDRTAEEYKALQDKKAAAEKKRREKLATKKMAETQKAMEEIFTKNEGVNAFQIKGKGLILVVPQSGDEIRKEGEALHHCVGGYVERVARGETNIFFIRKADHPEKSYFTMEWRDNKIIQCRGMENCGMPLEVKAFVQVFEKKMLEAINHDKKQQKARRCG